MNLLENSIGRNRFILNLAVQQTTNNISSYDRTGLNDNYIFESFVEGKSNQIALAAAKQVADQKRHRIEIRGFGTFCIRDRKSIRARNPKSGESIELPKRSIPYFRASKLLKQRIN